MPKVSVVTSTYNSAKYITATVESVLAQTFKDYEYIIVDDGSTDETGQLLEKYQDRLIYIYQENQKYSAARNRGIRIASGDYVAFLDSDDLWYPHKLERQVAVMEQHPEVSLIHSQLAYIDPTGNPIQTQGEWVRGPAAPDTVIADQTRELFLGSIATTSSVMIRRSVMDEVGIFDNSHIHGEDWELWVRVASKGPFAYIPDPLVKYRFYGWERVLRVESSEEWVIDQLRTIDRAVNLWRGEASERDRLRAEGLAMIYIRAALASFQLGNGVQGQVQLDKAIASDRELADKERLMHLAVDRAKLIETETGSYDQAVIFIKTFFDHLPASVSQHKSVSKEAIGWLYIGGAFEQHQRGNQAAVRSLLARGIVQSPVCLKNRGVLSVALQAWLGRALINRFG